MPQPSERIAIVTGTSSGIGAAVAGQLLDRGWQVVGLARRVPVLRHPNYTQLSVDLAEPQSATRTIEAEIGRLLDGGSWGRVGLVNNAASAGDPRPIEHLALRDLVSMYAVNVVAPTWLMGFVLRHTPRDAALRIVNVSSGAAVRPFPGLGAYGGTKAGLRMTGQILAAELDSPERPSPPPADAAILSYEPGVVDTEMQTAARSHSARDFPWVGMFLEFKRSGALVRASVPAAEIVDFLESDAQPRFAERRLGE